MMNDYLQQTAIRIRKRILSMCVKAGTGHVTSSFSCVELLAALYYGGVLRHDPNRPEWSYRDRFILSKGQASPALYAVLADRGYFPDEWLDGFAQAGGRMGVHLQKSIPGAEITCGSLGQGFGLAVGMALAAKMDGKKYRVYTLLGDGELYEGSIYETMLFSSHHKLNNLIAIVDRNGLSVMDYTENIIRLEPIESKWEAFGWKTQRIDGHDINALLIAFNDIKCCLPDGPTVIIAETIKGYPIKEVEGRALWHGVAPSEEVGQRWMEELG